MDNTEHKIAEANNEHSGPAFLFLGEALALDLVNTDILVRGKRFDFLSTPEDAVRWWHEANLHHPERDRVQGELEMTHWDLHLLEALKRLRIALRHLFLGLIEGHPPVTADLEELNQILRLGYRGLKVEAEGKLVESYYTVEPKTGAILLPIALSALHLITESDQNRLHTCSNDRCVALFYDTTRSATRHWCSSSCMNRARSIQHYQNKKKQK